MEPLRIGVLGAARISDNAIVKPAEDVGARLVAVAARDRSRAVQFAAVHGVERVLDSYADVLADPEVEAVYNPLANGLHGPWNHRAVEAGKHVLAEKPFASNAAEAKAVRDAGARAGVVVMEGFHYVYHPLMRRVLEVLASGEIGELVRLESVTDIPAPDADDPRWSLELAGGALMDLGCYSLHAARDVAQWAGGEPVLSAARGGERAGIPGVDEWVVAELTYPSGATARASCNMAADRVTFELRVTGTLGEVAAPSFAVPHADDRVIVTTADGGERVEHLGTRPSYSYQLEAFTRAVRSDAALPTDADDAVRQMELIDACYSSAGFAPRPRSVLRD